MRPDVPKQLGHKRLAKPHHLVVGFAFGIKVRAAFAAAHRQTRERVFKYLFEREKLDDAGTNGRMKTQTSFVRTERAIHLHAKAAVHLDLSFVVDPGNAKLNHSFRFDETLQYPGVSELLAAVDDWPNRLQHLGDCLKKLRLVTVTFADDFENFLD